MAPELRLPDYTYRAEVVKVIDGDTIDVRIDVGFNTHIFKRLRLLGIDTWEIRGAEKEKGYKAKDFVLSRLKVSRNMVYVKTEMDGKGKYGRVLAWVWTNTINGPVSLNEGLKENGHCKS